MIIGLIATINDKSLGAMATGIGSEAAANGLALILMQASLAVGPNSD